MGFLSAFKNVLASGSRPEPKDPHPGQRVAERDDEPVSGSPQGLDLAGFDLEDEDAFFHAIFELETDGAMGGTDAGRAQVTRTYGIRDHAHWLEVKQNVYTALIHKHGSWQEVAQREANWRMGQQQNQIQAEVAQAAASGELDPVDGVSLEAWAAFNAALIQGGHQDDLLKGVGMSPARWERVSAEWTARMSRDATFAIATVYGNAFQNASNGKWSAYAKEAIAARAENRDLNLAPPVTQEAFYTIMFAQAYAVKKGQTAVDALKAMGLTIIDWTDLGTYMGYWIHRHAASFSEEEHTIHEKVRAKFEAENPGLRADLDIAF